MIRVVLYTFAFLILVSLLRSAWGAAVKTLASLFGSRPSARSGAGLRKVADLKRDPVCGTYVSTATSIQRTVHGEVVHFCSDGCAAKYRGTSQKSH